MSVKISALTELTYPVQATDEVVVVRSGTTYKGDWGDLFRGFQKFVTGFDGYIIIPGTGNVDPTIVEQDDILVGKGAFFSGDYVMMRATQDSPTLDAHFAVGVRGQE